MSTGGCPSTFALLSFQRPCRSRERGLRAQAASASEGDRERSRAGRRLSVAAGPGHSGRRRPGLAHAGACPPAAPRRRARVESARQDLLRQRLPVDPDALPARSSAVPHERESPKASPQGAAGGLRPSRPRRTRSRQRRPGSRGATWSWSKRASAVAGRLLHRETWVTSGGLGRASPRRDGGSRVGLGRGASQKYSRHRPRQGPASPCRRSPPAGSADANVVAGDLHPGACPRCRAGSASS